MVGKDDDDPPDSDHEKKIGDREVTVIVASFSVLLLHSQSKRLSLMSPGSSFRKRVPAPAANFCYLWSRSVQKIQSTHGSSLVIKASNLSDKMQLFAGTVFNTSPWGYGHLHFGYGRGKLLQTMKQIFAGPVTPISVEELLSHFKIPSPLRILNFVHHLVSMKSPVGSCCPALNNPACL